MLRQLELDGANADDLLTKQTGVSKLLRQIDALVFDSLGKSSQDILDIEEISREHSTNEVSKINHRSYM